MYLSICLSVSIRLDMYPASESAAPTRKSVPDLVKMLHLSPNQIATRAKWLCLPRTPYLRLPKWCSCHANLCREKCVRPGIRARRRTRSAPVQNPSQTHERKKEKVARRNWFALPRQPFLSFFSSSLLFFLSSFLLLFFSSSLLFSSLYLPLSSTFNRQLAFTYRSTDRSFF